MWNFEERFEVPCSALQALQHILILDDLEKIYFLSIFRPVKRLIFVTFMYVISSTCVKHYVLVLVT